MVDTQLLNDVAKALGPEWSVELREYQQFLHSPNLKLYCFNQTWGSQKGRLKIGLAVPNEISNSAYLKNIPNISADPCRSPEAIAKDIIRRLLPTARAKLAELSSTST